MAYDAWTEGYLKAKQSKAYKTEQITGSQKAFNRKNGTKNILKIQRRKI